MSYGIEEDHNGLFGLCVFDAENTSDDEVVNVFEKFGSIKNWNRIKNLLFIRYGSLEEAVNCYEKMQSQSEFRVKPARRKGGGDRQDNQRPRDRFGDQNKGGEMNYRKNESGFQNRGSDNVQSSRKPMPNLKFDVPQTEQQMTDGASSEAQVYHRVIVAHFHPHTKQSDIYNLCSKAQAPPSHVDMKSFTRSPYAPEYYAIVHVMTESDVINIVRGLNNLKINGYQLVVAPYESLVEDGKSSQGR